MPDATEFTAFLQALRSPKFRELRLAQSYVLDEYNKFLAKTDLGIELPTGAGKTLIALLVAELWRRVGRKVAILSANKTLARQMVREASALGVPVTLMEGPGRDIPGADKRAFHRADSIGVMNYWVYFNQNPVIDPADLLVMDDAHLAEHCLHSLYSVEIERHEHEALFKSLVTELRERFPDYAVLTDALADDSVCSSPPELLSFIDQAQVVERIRQIVDSSPYLENRSDLHYRWARLRPYLKEANIYLSLNSIWIRPYIYPLISNYHYQEAQQRLYVSATIGDPSDLSRRLGTKPIEKIPVPAQYADQTYGRRLIVMNRIEDKDIPKRLQAVILTALRLHPKSVWLCASQAEASKVSQAVNDWLNENGFVGHPSWVLTSLGNEIDDFKRSPTGHLFVGGRFDGMDFNADECRLVVVKTLPRAINIQEEFICAYLRDSGFMRRRLNQRIVQSLGRCNRSEEDYAVYVLADRRFATHFGRESNRQGIPPNMVAEIDMAQDHADIDEDRLLAGVQRFLRRDFANFDKDNQAYRASLPTHTAHAAGSPDMAGNEILGWTALFHSQNYEVAADKFEECWDAAIDANIIEMGAFHGWNLSKALFLQSLQGAASAREKSLRILEKAITRGGQSSWFNRMRASLNRARQAAVVQPIPTDYSVVVLRAFDDHLERLGTTDRRFDKWCQSLSSALESEHHDEFTDGLLKLGTILGYTATRPRYTGATDNRWRGSFGNQKEVVTFEVKIEHVDQSGLVLRDIGQAHNQLARAQTEFVGHGYSVRGTIVTHLNSIESSADASASSIRVIPKSAILELWDRTKLLMSSYRDRWSLDDMQARSAAAMAVQPRIPSAGWLIRALDHPDRILKSEALLAEWD